MNIFTNGEKKNRITSSNNNNNAKTFYENTIITATDKQTNNKRHIKNKGDFQICTRSGWKIGLRERERERDWECERLSDKKSREWGKRFKLHIKCVAHLKWLLWVSEGTVCIKWKWFEKMLSIHINVWPLHRLFVHFMFCCVYMPY